MRELPKPLVSAGWLESHLADPDLRILDVRWHLAGPSGLELHRQGHLPGAVFVDLDRDITAAEGAGRHPLPGREQFQAAMRRAGVSRSSHVIACDDEAGSIAARLWFLLRAFGHPQVAVLDGGVQAWKGELEQGDPAPPQTGDFIAREPDWSLVVGFDEVAQRPPGTVLLDARLAPRYRGEVEPIDPKAGHIPGAVSAPWPDSVGPDGTLLPPERLRERFSALGVGEGRRAVAYCGSGVTSCHHLLAMEVARLPPARLYAGSWSDWCARGGEVATGPEPG